ncbi:MAG: flavodoxin [Clostridiales bacterium]|nr:flavodoxin [Clostridiales bacterium]
MKRIISVLILATMLLGLSACAPSGDDTPESAPQTTGTSKVSDTSEDTPSTETEEEVSDRILVCYFSATGNTEGVAQKIASVSGGELYEIVPAEEYTSADLEYNDPDSRATAEQDDPSVRPEIASPDLSLEGVTTIYLGYPIWWGEEPRIMDTFVESYDFDGINVIPFCTSGSSGIETSSSNLEDVAGSGNWLEGRRFEADVSEDEIADFIGV